MSTPRLSLALTVALTALAIGLSGCQAQNASVESATAAATPSPVESSARPTPTASPTPTPVAFATRREGDLDVGEPPPKAGPRALVVDEQLYTLDQVQPASLIPEEGVDEERLDTRWAVQQDPDAPVGAVSVALIRTAPSGLNTVPDQIRLQSFDGRGVATPPVQLDPSITGVVEQIGWTQAGLGGDATLIGDILVFATRVGYDTSVLVGIDVHSGTVLWRHDSPKDLRSDALIVLGPGLLIASWDGAVSAVAPATGALIWTNPQLNSIAATSSPSYLRGSLSTPTGGLTRSIVDPATGTIIDDGFDEAVFDPVTGEAVLSFLGSRGFIPEGKPAMRVYSSAGAVEYELPASAKDSLGSLRLLGAFDGRTWISTSAGIDIVSSTTGDRDPSAPSHDQSTGAGFDVPVFGTEGWTVMHEFGFSSGYGVIDGDGTPYTLIRHPQGQLTFAQLGKIA
ncbi:MAG: hypothetical protein EPO52_12390 [Herbiconiux sp.]|uniref:PQQ-binding-like beta-propeller repeat protein n=1 Tax=Herbiconiux sp. TaxID=1871186 RepID=UPI00121AC810|nr:PQQ-binding-like beta-propeller repeat protein [Herbiconiux sp.]TAJ47294.1 MAG: hypothetical protein EPO52_12390 [Herbiconiux sp.]